MPRRIEAQCEDQQCPPVNAAGQASNQWCTDGHHNAADQHELTSGCGSDRQVSRKFIQQAGRQKDARSDDEVAEKQDPELEPCFAVVQVVHCGMISQSRKALAVRPSDG